MVFFVFFLFLSVGLEEDFNAWKDGFVKNVFPILAGEVALSQPTSASSAVGGESSCECGGKRKKEYCKEKANEQVEEHMKVHKYYRVSSSGERGTGGSSPSPLPPPKFPSFPP